MLSFNRVRKLNSSVVHKPRFKVILGFKRSEKPPNPPPQRWWQYIWGVFSAVENYENLRGSKRKEELIR